MPTSYLLRLPADYHQLYLEDAGADALTVVQPQFWDARAQADGFASAPLVLALGTARHGFVSLSVTIGEAEPDDALDTWDHVVDGALQLPSGKLRVRSCTEAPEDAESFELAPGVYQVRAYYGNLAVDDPNAEEGEDHYKIALWPGAWREPQVRKRFNDDSGAQGASER